MDQDSISLYRATIHFIHDDYIPHPYNPAWEPWLGGSYSTLVNYANAERDGWYDQVAITDIPYDFEKHSDGEGPLFSHWVKKYWY